jgi:hypothetical protein
MSWASKYPEAKVPQLKEIISVAKENNKTLLFDLLKPSGDNPYSSDYISLVLDIAKQGFADQPELFWWLATVETKEELDNYANLFSNIRNNYNFRIACGLENLLAIDDVTDCDIINMEFGVIMHQKEAEEYYANHLLNVYTVNSKWLFSLCWSRGVDSVTTSNARVLSELESPIYRMSPATYYGIFIPIAATALLSFVATNLYAYSSTRNEFKESNSKARQFPAVLINENEGDRIIDSNDEMMRMEIKSCFFDEAKRSIHNSAEDAHIVSDTSSTSPTFTPQPDDESFSIEILPEQQMNP